MNRNFLISAIVVTLCLTVYQQCSMGGNDGSVNNLSSTNGGINDQNIPRVAFDFDAHLFQNSATTFSLTGNCNPGPFTNFTLDLGYRRNGTSTDIVKNYASTSCVDGRFTLTGTYSELQISSGNPGLFTLRIRAQRASGEVEGPASTTNVTWTASATSGGTSTGGTTPGTTTGPTCPQAGQPCDEPGGYPCCGDRICGHNGVCLNVGCWPDGYERRNVNSCCSGSYNTYCP